MRTLTSVFLGSTKISRSPPVLLCDIIYVQFQPYWAAVFAKRLLLVSTRNRAVHALMIDGGNLNVVLAMRVNGGYKLISE